MKISKNIQKFIKSFLGVLLAILLFFSSGLRFPVLDDTTDIYFREAITKAGVAYATCRVINASVSIVQNSTLNMEPAGIGLTLAVGQVLDPVDDLTERVSDVLVTAIVSLGVQKLAYEIGLSTAPPILAVFLLFSSLLILFNSERLAIIQKTLIRFILLILIVRFALTISAVANNYIYENFFSGKIERANNELALAAGDIDKLMEFSLPEVDGLLGTIKNSASFLQRKSKELKDALVSTVSNAGKIIENLMQLAFMYAGIFIIQVIALPLLVFWLLLKLVYCLIGTNTPAIPGHSTASMNMNIQSASRGGVNFMPPTHTTLSLHVDQHRRERTLDKTYLRKNIK